MNHLLMTTLQRNLDDFVVMEPSNLKQKLKNLLIENEPQLLTLQIFQHCVLTKLTDLRYFHLFNRSCSVQQKL